MSESFNTVSLRSLCLRGSALTAKNLEIIRRLCPWQQACPCQRAKRTPGPSAPCPGFLPSLSRVPRGGRCSASASRAVAGRAAQLGGENGGHGGGKQ